MDNTCPTPHFDYVSHYDGSHTITRTPHAPSDHVLVTAMASTLTRWVLPFQGLCLVAALVLGQGKSATAPALVTLGLIIAITLIVAGFCRFVAGRATTITIPPVAVDLEAGFNTLRVAQRVMRDDSTSYDHAAWDHLVHAQQQIAAAEVTWPGAEYEPLRSEAQTMALDGFIAQCNNARAQVLALEVMADDESEVLRIRTEMQRGSFDETFA